MKRYLVFAGDYYYPAGGWDDFKGDFDDAEQAARHAKSYDEKNVKGEWWHVVDGETMKVIVENWPGASPRAKDGSA